MKSCPSCQQTYPDGGPDFCTTDGTPLVSFDPSYAHTPPPGNQWQASGAQAPPGWQQPPPGYGYPPPGQYPPYGYAPHATRSAGVSKAALFTGIGSLGTFLLAISLAVVGVSSRNLRDMIPIIGILGLLSLLAGLTAIVLGIITLNSASRNPAMNKVHGILGIIFGAIPLILWLFGLVSGSSRRF
jgi:hypothetical protein